MEKDVIKQDEYLQKKAAKSAAIFTQELINVLSLNGKKINQKDMDYVYKSIFYAEL